MNLEVLADTFSHVASCCLPEPLWKPEEAEEVLAAFWGGYYGWKPLEDYKESSDSDSVIAVRLKDGTFGLLGEGEDYTGHGCRCGSWTGRYSSIPELLLACELDYRELMAEALKEAAND